MSFMDKLSARWDEGYFVCVGLDSDVSKLPACIRDGEGGQEQLRFNMAIVDATADIVCAYKPNTAFYEALGTTGIMALEETIEYITSTYPHIPVILDAKRADIGNTNAGYVSFAFDQLGADAITVHPYLGREALGPFLECTDKGIIVLCRTSNTGAGEFQDRIVSITAEEAKLWGLSLDTTMPLYQLVAWRVSREWNGHNNCAVVVGATYPEELSQVREIVGDMPILIPGLGTQGGEIKPTVTAGQTKNGRGMINNLSRGVIFASSGNDFAEAARQVVIDVNSETDLFRTTV